MHDFLPTEAFVISRNLRQFFDDLASWKGISIFWKLIKYNLTSTDPGVQNRSWFTHKIFEQNSKFQITVHIAEAAYLVLRSFVPPARQK